MPAAPKIPPITGRTVSTYPTPDIRDSIEIETVDAVAGLYHPVPFGTKYKEVEHGAFASDFAEYVLCGDAPADPEGKYRKRTWVSNRVDQEVYNFSIGFEVNHSDFPNYTRTYVLPREGYTPLELLSVDPVDPFAFLVAEQVISDVEPAELKNVFIKVVRVYMTLPGPITYTIEYPYGGNPSAPRITTKQKCSHMEFPQSVGTKCPVENYTDAALVAQTVQQGEMFAIDIVQRIYDIVPKVDSGGVPNTGGYQIDGVNYHGQEGYGYSIGYMDGSRDHPFITWSFAVGSDAYSPMADLSPCPIKGFELLRLVNQQADGDEKQSQLLHVKRRYETLPGPMNSKVDYENNDPLLPILTTSQRVAWTEYSAGTPRDDYCKFPGYTGLMLVEQHLAPTDFASVREDQRIYENNPGGVITSYDYDSLTDTFIETSRQKIFSTGASFGDLDPMVLEYRQKPLDKYRTIQIQSRLLALPPVRIEYKTVNNWAFPTLLTGIKLDKVGLVANRNEVSWFPNTLRPIQNVPAILRVTTSYYTSLPPAETIFVLPTRNIVYSGISFQLSISNVLCDAIALSVTFSADTKYGGLTEGVTFAATNPSATQYYAVIGQYRTVACDISVWRGKIYVKSTSEVILV